VSISKDDIKEPWGIIVLILFMLMTAMLGCLMLILAYRVGLEMQWQHIQAINDCVSYNLGVLNKDTCIV
jgi:hypothetical protein